MKKISVAVVIGLIATFVFGGAGPAELAHQMVYPENQMFHGAYRVTLIVLLSVIALALLVLVPVVASRRRFHRKKEQYKMLFSDVALHFDLSYLQLQKIKALMPQNSEFPPTLIFYSLQIFEKCLNEHIKQLVASGASAADKDQETRILSDIRAKLGFYQLDSVHPIASSRNISIGQAGAIMGSHRFIPIIEHAVVVDNNEFILSLKYDSPEDMSDKLGSDPLTFVFARYDDAVYKVPLKVVEFTKTIVQSQHSVEIKRKQLRHYERVETKIHVSIDLVSNDESEKPRAPEYAKKASGTILDLSGGGLCFISQEQMRIGDDITLSFKLPLSGETAMHFLGQVKDVQMVMDQGKTSYKHQIQFLDLQPSRVAQMEHYVNERKSQIPIS